MTCQTSVGCACKRSMVASLTADSDRIIPIVISLRMPNATEETRVKKPGSKRCYRLSIQSTFDDAAPNASSNSASVIARQADAIARCDHAGTVVM